MEDKRLVAKAFANPTLVCLGMMRFCGDYVNEWLSSFLAPTGRPSPFTSLAAIHFSIEKQELWMIAPNSYILSDNSV